MANINNRQYDLHGEGIPLLNSMKNSTSALGHALEVTEVNFNLTITRREEAQDDHGRALQTVTQLEDALASARNNAVITNNHLTTNRDAVDAALRARDSQRVRTLVMHEATMVHVVQYLFDQGVQDMEDDDRSLTRRIVEIAADAIDYPQYHSKLTRCGRIRRTLCSRDKTVGPAFQ